MKKITMACAVLLMVLMSAAFMFAGCSTSSTTQLPHPLQPPLVPVKFQGTITDESGVPLSGAQVTLTQSAGTSSLEKGQIATDDSGQFIFENLATGVLYNVSIRYNGRVTVVTLIELTDQNAAPNFKLFLPLGDGSASFEMPTGASLNTRF